jgi:3-oxoacyl-[acyl-carrier protein] reductase
MAMPTVLITGCSRGLGRGLVDHFLTSGWIVYGCSRSLPDVTSPSFTHYQVDLMNSDELLGMIRVLRRSLSSLDVIVNNAGSGSMSPFLLQPAVKVREMFDLNFHAATQITQGCIRLLRGSRNPRVINFSTAAVPYRLMGESIYSASKAAIEQWTRVVAHELGPWGITVNALGPTPIRTELIRGVPEEKLEQLIQRQAIRRWGTIADVINAVDFLVRPQSSFITGQVIYLGGAG